MGCREPSSGRQPRYVAGDGCSFRHRITSLIDRYESVTRGRRRRLLGLCRQRWRWWPNYGNAGAIYPAWMTDSPTLDSLKLTGNSSEWL